MRKPLYIVLSAVALLLASAASYAIASTSQPAASTASATIRACKNNRTGALYLKARCPKGYSVVEWGVRGPAGPAGAPGKNAANGSNGSSGTAGADGTAASVSVGTVNTGAPGSNASVTNTGTSSAAKLNFTIPQGLAGSAGTTPWSTAVDLDTELTGDASIKACPYSASTGTTSGTPATAVIFEGSSYEFTASSCKTVTVDNAFGPGSEVKTGGDENAPDVDPSDWTLIASGGVSPWSAPVNLDTTTSGYTVGVEACPFSQPDGRPATSIEFEGSSYEYTGNSCKNAISDPTDPASNENTPDVDPSDWTEIAAAGANGTADAWAFIDPGVCANGGSCTSPVINHGGVPGSGVGFDYLHVGQYELTITGCPASDTPASGQPDPVAISVTPEGAYPGESSNDSSVIAVTDSIRNTTSLGVLGGLGIVHAFMYLGTPDTTTVGQTDSIDEPFAVSVDC